MPTKQVARYRLATYARVCERWNKCKRWPPELVTYHSASWRDTLGKTLEATCNSLNCSEEKSTRKEIKCIRRQCTSCVACASLEVWNWVLREPEWMLRNVWKLFWYFSRHRGIERLEECTRGGSGGGGLRAGHRNRWHLGVLGGDAQGWVRRGAQQHVRGFAVG